MRQNPTDHVMAGSSFESVSFREWQVLIPYAQAYKSFGQIVMYFLRNCIKNYFQKLGFLNQGIEKEHS